MPTPNTIDSIFDEEKARELFASDHKDIKISVRVFVKEVKNNKIVFVFSLSCIIFDCFFPSHLQAGPKWNTKPPSLTITVSDDVVQGRSSGIRTPKLYHVRTKVSRISPCKLLWILFDFRN